VRHPEVLKMIMDSLRYWRNEMHVDGSRFDLAAALARELHEVSRLSSFFDTIHQDPSLAEVKLIAEPWDVGDGGYQVGNFPVLWAEWNGKYRDTVRRYWKGDAGMLSDFAYRITGSSDLYKNDGRKPSASINFVTAHDGFTLNDLVSYNEKHNDANGEQNRDGSDNNDSWNMGAEGPTDDPVINELRERQMRNFLATLMISQGVPMIAGGDEVARTQNGNNNTYCQDNELTWFNWELSPEQERLLSFARRIVQLRLAHPNLRRRRFFQDRVIRTPGGGKPVKVVKDIAWCSADGNELDDAAWGAEWIRAIALLLNGQTLQITGENGESVIDHSFLLMINASYEGVEFVLPPSPIGNPWVQIVDTENIADPFAQVVTGEKMIVGGRALKIFNDALI
jgi:isoamylase